MKSNRLEKWLKNIYNTQEEEISCSECFDLVAHYVDAELAGEDVQAELPQVRQHLEQCSACRDEYEALRDLRHMEEDGAPPSLDELEDLLP